VAWSFPLPDYVVHETTGVGWTVLTEKHLPWLDMLDIPKVLSVPDLEFNNYGETVKNTPRQTFFPKTVAEVQSLVRSVTFYACKLKLLLEPNQLRVECSP
jgi:hypothetical protein